MDIKEELFEKIVLNGDDILDVISKLQEYKNGEQISIVLQVILETTESLEKVLKLSVNELLSYNLSKSLSDRIKTLDYNTPFTITQSDIYATLFNLQEKNKKYINVNNIREYNRRIV